MTMTDAPPLARLGRFLANNPLAPLILLLIALLGLL